MTRWYREMLRFVNFFIRTRMLLAIGVLRLDVNCEMTSVGTLLCATISMHKVTDAIQAGGNTSYQTVFVPHSRLPSGPCTRQ